MIKEPFVVLLAEDNEDDILAIRRAWKINSIANPLYIVRNGEECLDYLYQRGKYADPASAPRPGILLLDIKMPRMDGLTVIEMIRSEEKLRRLPIIILTSSKMEEDRLKGYDLGANAFITKPVGFDNFSEAVKAIHLFWALVELPE
jgi:CheY-like chemotaxis protein